MRTIGETARDRLVLEIGAPTVPVAIRRPDDGHTFSLLMPVRLENWAETSRTAATRPPGPDRTGGALLTFG